MLEYKRHSVDLGFSDIASLVVRFYEGVNELKFDGDGRYSAYIVTDPDVEIPAHYNKVLSGSDWVMVYDDERCTFSCYGSEINIYRAGDYGCLIQIIGGDSNQ